MTSKTLLRFLTRDRSSECVCERRGHALAMTDREVEPVELVEKTHARLVKHVVVAKDISLADVTLPEAIQDRRADTLRAIGNRVDEVFPSSRELVSVVS